MQTDEMLERLRDIRLPPIPSAPPPPWLFLSGAALALIVIGALLALRFGRSGWRGEARSGFAALAARGEDPEALAEAAKLLRRVALRRLGPEAAKLTGEAWLKRLDELFRTEFFTQGAGRVFGAALYGPSPGPVAPALRGLAALTSGPFGRPKP